MGYEDTKISTLRGVGPKREELLAKAGITTLRELLHYFPAKYDYFEFYDDISEIDIPKKVAFYLVYDGNAKKRYSKTTGFFISWQVKCGSATLEFYWFNQPYLINSFVPGKRYLIKCTLERKSKVLRAVNARLIPDMNVSGNIIEPVYRGIDGISSTAISKLMALALEQAEKDYDAIPEEIRTKYGIGSEYEALCGMHFPKNEYDCIKSMQRFIFEEFCLFRMRQVLSSMKRKKEGAALDFEKQAVTEFIKRLPYRPTDAQARAIDDVMNDLLSPAPMNRIIQGDVGSGKTLVAFAGCLMTVCSGHQAIMMVPTEVLARQHADSFDKTFEGFGLKAGLLVGSLKASEKKKVKEDFASGAINVLIGTHAVLEDDVSSGNVGLVITDEQHRFGVRQRFGLKMKGRPVNMLVMTATPIPRTLSMAVYGDLDVSIIDELPPGRSPVKTYSVRTDMRERIYKFIVREVSEGRQAYVICPLVEDDEDSSKASVKSLFDELSGSALKDVRTGILYGSMKPDDKEKVMNSFANGETDVLISTTVIEVGINVPNATVIVIENAERFGLAQLHQLRGRVGRGQYQSHCILISDATNETALARLKTLVKTTNGFEIAEEDMKLRGAGEYFGLRQSGTKQFTLGELPRDAMLFAQAADAVAYAEKNQARFSEFFEGMKEKALSIEKEIVFN